MTGHNHVTLLGTIGERGVELRPVESGTMMASCRVCVPEESPSGQTFNLWVPLHAYGKARDVLEGCEPGEAVLVEGKLRWHSWQDHDGKKQGMLIVVALAVKRLTAPVAAVG